MLFIWQEILFRPLLNLLIGLYNTIGAENLGLAIVWMTVVVRIILLPFSITDEKRRQKQIELEDQLADLEKSYANDPTVLREEQRKLLKKFRFRRWPKVIVLGVQGLILLVFYQVFIGGINFVEIVDSLYSFISVPEDINSQFLGVDIAKRSFILSFLCGLVLFVSIWAEHRKHKKTWHSSEILYAVGFPAATVAILWYLPAVKAVFIFSSLIFTDILKIISAFRSSVKEQNTMIKQAKEAAVQLKKDTLPHPKERFK